MPQARKKQKVTSDKELFSALSEDRIILTEEQIERARNQDGGALYKIGVKYIKKTNYSKALQWFRKAADQNHSGAQNHIGVLYRNGQGVPYNYKQAMTWYLRAVNNDGNKEAQYNIGVLFQQGCDVPKNIYTAIDWYTKSANQGYVNAQTCLGWIYKDNEEVKDLQKAVDWFQKAADNGYTSICPEIQLLNDQGYYAGGEYEDEYEYDEEYEGEYEAEYEGECENENENKSEHKLEENIKNKVVGVEINDGSPQIDSTVESRIISTDETEHVPGDETNQQEEPLSLNQKLDSHKSEAETNKSNTTKEKAQSENQNESEQSNFMEEEKNKQLSETYPSTTDAIELEKMKRREEIFLSDLYHIIDAKSENERMFRQQITALEKEKARMDKEIKKLKETLQQTMTTFDENPSIETFYH